MWRDGMDTIDIKDVNYWVARATTAELKIKEWSVRTCEAEERIAKAREILHRNPAWGDRIKDALEALEGK